MKFAEFFVGQRIESRPYPVSEAEILSFARTYDPQWFHVDVARARGGPFGGLIASGWLTCAIAMRLAVEAALEGSESYASPGLNQVKWPHPVRPGDTLQLAATVTDHRLSSKTPTLGILQWRWQMHNQARIVVLDIEAVSLFKLAPA